MCGAINRDRQLIASFCNAGQGHVFRWWDEIGAEGQARLLGLLRSVDLERLAALIADVKAGRLTPRFPSKPEHPAYVRLPRTPKEERERAAARQAGEELLRAGKAAPLTVAGGQASRLEFDEIKGAYPIGPVSGTTLFQIHAERIRAVRRRYGCALPWYIMTSEPTDALTRDYFEREGYFGLPPQDVRFFRQGMMPVLDRDSKLAMTAKDSILLSPDGNGGLFRALLRTGTLDDMERRGVDHISYFNVDNPLVPAVDPVFVGFHHLAGAQMSCKTLLKRDPHEPMGAFVKDHGRIAVVEYSDLTDAQKRRQRPDGSLFYGLGSPAIHVMSVAFARQEAGRTLPFHLAEKSSPYLDETGNLLQSEERNVFKFEMFVFDALRDAERTLLLEIRREEEFSPVKQLTGPDSVESSRGDMTALYASWLEAAGIGVPRDANGRPIHPIEISPLYTLDAPELADKVSPDLRVEGPLYLGPAER